MQGRRRLVTKIAIASKCFSYDLFQINRNVRIDLTKRRNLAFANFFKCVDFVVGNEQTIVSEQFPKHDAQRENVGTKIDNLAFCLLRAHVAEFTLESSSASRFDLCF